MFQLVRYGRWKSPLKNQKKSQSNPLLAFYISTAAAAARDDSNPSRPSPPPIRVFAHRVMGQRCVRDSGDRSCSFGHGLVFIMVLLLAYTVFYEVEKQAAWSAYREYYCTQGLKYPLLAKRLACMVMSGVANADSLDILQPAILSPEMILQMEKEFALLRSAFEDAYVTDEQMACILCVCQRELAGGLYDYQDPLSSAAALVDAEATLGNVIYMLPSFYDHDCDPNAHIVWIENSDARVKALCDNEAGLFHVKSCGSAILMLVWPMMLGKCSFLKGLDLGVNALGVCWVIEELYHPYNLHGLKDFLSLSAFNDLVQDGIRP
ncbi:hypothetical protein RHMOL_Rhmol01G0299600 [Rhododendron molle]|uniref:Uncharacterized protein n=1 Tax=Rhododendron molle TaxID=49168 RepID=A0ACC0Q943_RHOML|nr:hypothetical protein RHMOL_Rhmol01G0299600 [Rhododendron molle]